MNIQNEIQEFILQNIVIFDDEINLSPDDNIFQNGYVNSLFSMRIISFIENKYSIEITHEDIDINNFNSIKAICNFIKLKKGDEQ